MYNVFRKAKDSTKIHRTVIKQMLTMFLTCDNGLISAIFLRNLCVQKTKPVRSLRNLCVTIDQCDTLSYIVFRMAQSEPSSGIKGKAIYNMNLSN